jgi:hypothetical protein
MKKKEIYYKMLSGLHRGLVKKHCRTELLKELTKKNQPGVGARVYNPSYSGGRGRRITAQGQMGKHETYLKSKLKAKG